MPQNTLMKHTSTLSYKDLNHQKPDKKGYPKDDKNKAYIDCHNKN